PGWPRARSRMVARSKPEHSIAVGTFDRAVAHDRETQAEPRAHVTRIDDAVVTDRARRDQRERALLLHPLDGGHDLGVLLFVERSASARRLPATNLRHDARDLFGSHHGDLGRRPYEREAVAERPARHAVRTG